ncbi:hypothetical protein BOTBODRAFT_36346 [Botryobasidium botryosum FD-172 SS1]|uniref:Uncharacterized protein n=1 Tax=Botryobasidium botryosum (strain FD-172 SS1) TaxID=930990 RepID=A0A067MF61_BOTB1|nr:hypothetical protein BOTBODRAFT_36346 [Botryobasidium botryosum FD-172 SS1]
MLGPLSASLLRHLLDLIPLCRFPQGPRAFNMALDEHHVDMRVALDAILFSPATQNMF